MGSTYSGSRPLRNWRISIVIQVSSVMEPPAPGRVGCRGKTNIFWKIYSFFLHELKYLWYLSPVRRQPQITLSSLCLRTFLSHNLDIPFGVLAETHPPAPCVMCGCFHDFVFCFCCLGPWFILHLLSQVCEPRRSSVYYLLTIIQVILNLYSSSSLLFSLKFHFIVL